MPEVVDVWTALQESTGPGFGSLLCSDGAPFERPAVPQQRGYRVVLVESPPAPTTPHADLRRLERLTAEQATVLRAIAAGRTIGQVADSWHVTEAVVRNQVRGVLAMLGVTSQVEAIATARLAGWLDS